MIEAEIWSGSVLLRILIAAASLCFLFVIPELLKILPLMGGCMMRMKECLMLQNSASLSRCRDKVAAAMVLPFIILTSRYCIYPPASGSEITGCILIHSSALLAYFLLRRLEGLALRWKSSGSDDLECSAGILRIMFVTTALLAIASAGICRFAGVEESVIQSIILWEIAAVYLIGLIRQIQIFVYYDGILSGILYLCILEILPTGLLVTSALIF